MRKVTKKIVNAFVARKPASDSNSFTDGNALYLHNNKIAEWRDGDVWITTAGWDTTTTKERLNSLCLTLLDRRPIYTSKHQLMLADDSWDGDWINISEKFRK